MFTSFTNYFTFTTGRLNAGAHDCVLQPGSDRHEGDADDHDNDMDNHELLTVTGWLRAGAHDCVLQPYSDRRGGDAEHAELRDARQEYPQPPRCPGKRGKILSSAQQQPEKARLDEVETHASMRLHCCRNLTHSNGDQIGAVGSMRTLTSLPHGTMYMPSVLTTVSMRLQLDAQEATISALRREVHALRSENMYGPAPHIPPYLWSSTRLPALQSEESSVLLTTARKSSNSPAASSP